jgi:hypothetical protein
MYKREQPVLVPRNDGPIRENLTGSGPALETIWTSRAGDRSAPGECVPEAIKFRLDQHGMMRKDLELQTAIQEPPQPQLRASFQATIET